MQGKVGSLGEILTQQTVGIFIRSALPGAFAGLTSREVVYEDLRI